MGESLRLIPKIQLFPKYWGSRNNPNFSIGSLFLLRRLFFLALLLFAVESSLIFLFELAPGSALEYKFSQGNFLGHRAQVPDQLGSNVNVFQRFLHESAKWFQSLFTGSFGRSEVYEEKVLSLLGEKFAVTGSFAIMAFLGLYVLGLPLGAALGFSLLNRWMESGMKSFLSFLHSLPTVVLGLLLIIFFSGADFLALFPLGGATSDGYEQFTATQKVLDRIWHLTLPAACFIFSNLSDVVIFIENSLRNSLNANLMKRKRLYGASKIAIIVQSLFIQTGPQILLNSFSVLRNLFLGSFLLELVFRLDGWGALFFNSLIARDRNVVLAISFLVTLGLGLLRIATDYWTLARDPRLRLQAKGGN